MKTITEFWQCINHMTPPSKIQKRTSPNLMFFRDNIFPEWEDPKNKNGGLWSFRITGRNLREKLNEMWLETLITLIGEQIPNSEFIAGCYLQKRQREDRIQLWTMTDPNKSIEENKIIQTEIGSTFKNILVSLVKAIENNPSPCNTPCPINDLTANPMNGSSGNPGNNTDNRFDRIDKNSRSAAILNDQQDINIEFITHSEMENATNTYVTKHNNGNNNNNRWSSMSNRNKNRDSRKDSVKTGYEKTGDVEKSDWVTVNNVSNNSTSSNFFNKKDDKRRKFSPSNLRKSNSSNSSRRNSNVVNANANSSYGWMVDKCDRLIV